MDQADGQSVKLSNNIIFGSWMGDPMLSDCLLGTWVIDLIFFSAFSLHRIYESDLSQDFGSKFWCFHRNMSSIMFLNYSSKVFKNCS